MLSTMVKKWALLAIMPISMFLSISSLNAAYKKKPHIHISKLKSYTFQTSYTLHEPSSKPSSSNRLQVKINGRHDYGRTLCAGTYCIPMGGKIALQFVLNNTLKCIEIWSSSNNSSNYTIEKLETAHLSPWYLAIEKLATELGIQYYGKTKFKNEFPHQINLKKTPSCISIKPLKNLKLQTQNLLFTDQILLPNRTMHVKVDVQLKNSGQGKKRIVATATCMHQIAIDIEKEYSIIKFVYTKHGLKELSKKRIKHSSIWYSAIERVARRSVRRYFTFQHRLNHIARTIETTRLSIPNMIQNSV